MNNCPKISVIMLNYNGLKYLEETVVPILNLNYPDFEFIVVDNGSTDGSIEFLKKYGKIQLILSQRIGEKNFACNLGAKKAKGSYILFLDNDVIINDLKILENLFKQSLKLDRFGCYSVSLVNRGEDNTQFYGVFPNHFFAKNNKYISIAQLEKLHNIYIGYPNGAAFFIEKSKWDEVGGYDDSLSFGGDDNDVGIKLWLRGYKNYLYSKSFQTHIGMQERINNKKYTIKLKYLIYAHLYTIVKNFNFFNCIFTLIGYSIESFLRSIKQSMSRRSMGPARSFFIGYSLFLKNLPTALYKRKSIQKNRIIKKDIFFKIKSGI